MTPFLSKFVSVKFYQQLISAGTSFNNSHKKLKGSKDRLETWAELAVLHFYVENRATLEPILDCASKCKQTKA